MVIVPSPGSIWDYPYLNQVTSMMGLVYGTRSKPEQDLFPSKIRIPEIHVIFPFSIPFHLFNISVRSLRDLRSILYFITRTMSFRFFPSSFPVFFSSSSRHFRLVNLRKKFLLDRRKKRSWKRSRHILSSFLSSCLRIVSRSIHLLPSFFFLLPPFSRIGNSILEKAKNVVDKRPWRNAVRTFLCTIEYDCEIIDNLEWLHRRSWLHFIQRFDLYQEFCLRCLLTPNIYKYRSMFSFLPSFFFF